MSPRRAAQPDVYTAAVARELRSQRVAAGFTLVGWSERSGVPISTLNRLLQARRAITIAQLAALAPVFGITPATLLTLAERRTRAAVATPTRPDGGRNTMTDNHQCRWSASRGNGRVFAVLAAGGVTRATGCAGPP